MTVVFDQIADDTFDLIINGRLAEPDVPKIEFADALRRRRVPKDVAVQVRDLDGRMAALARR